MESTSNKCKKQCLMQGCDGRHPLKFFALPADEPRRSRWIKACGGPEAELRIPKLSTTRAYVCERHFKFEELAAKRLSKYVDPLPYMPPTLNEHETGDSCSANDELNIIDETPDQEHSNSEQSMRDKRAQIMNLKSLQDSFKHMKFLNSTGLLENAFLLYLKMPMTYKSFRDTLFLPKENLLRKIDFDIDVGISKKARLFLTENIKSLQKRNRYCTLCLKKMTLRRFLYYRIGRDKVIGFHNVNEEIIADAATHVYVLVARGLCASWSQPLTFCFLAHDDFKEINVFLDTSIQIATEIGYNIVAIVVDPEDSFEHFRKKIVSVVQPYFFVQERKVYCIFDLPLLIISLRNTLMSQELRFTDGGETVVASWDTIRELYERYAVDGRCRILPKLTRSHVDPDQDEKTQLKYAVEVFSKSVWQTLELESASRGEAGCRARGTRRLIQLVDDVFNILNSSSFSHQNSMKAAFTGDALQMKAIRQFMEFLTDVKPADLVAPESIACIEGLRITIMSFSIILRDLLPKGITSLLTHRFNLDTVHRFFDDVKRSTKHCKPTAFDFYRCFRRTFVNSLIKSALIPRKSDDVKSLIKSNLKIIESPPQNCVRVGTVDYRYPAPPARPFLRLCWYLLKKCCEVHECSVTLRDHGLEGVSWDSYFQPPQAFVIMIKKLEQNLQEVFSSKPTLHLGHSIMQNTRIWLGFCPCLSEAYLLKIYVRVRIFQIFRYNNSRFHEESFMFTARDEVAQDCSEHSC